MRLFNTKSNAGMKPEDPENVSSDLAPVDRKGVDTEPAEDEHKWVSYVHDRFKDARIGGRRWEMENRVLQSLAMTAGDEGQWRYWRGADIGYEDLRNQSEIYRYITDDQIAPILDRVASLATASEPDARITGMTVAPLDQAAAKEAQGLMRAWEEDFGLQSFLLDGVSLTLRTTTCWARYQWDKDKMGLLPKTGPDGTIEKVTQGKAGGPRVDWIPWYQGFPYGDVHDSAPDKMRGFITAKLLTLNELIERYGSMSDKAEKVQPDGGGDVLNYFQSRYAYLAGQFDYDTKSAGINKSHVVCYELMETATPRYPNGLLVIVAGNRCLHHGDLPAEDKTRLPLVPLCYHRRDGTPWGSNVVYPLVPLQRAINRCWSNTFDMLDNQQVYVAIEKNAELTPPDPYAGADSFMDGSKRGIKKIYHRPGSNPPQFQLPPTPTQEAMAINEALLDRMKAISGIRDSIAGAAPAADSGIKVSLLQQAAKSQLALFTQQIETFVQDLTEAVIALYAANATSSQLLADDEAADPQQRGLQAKALQSLTQGGRTRVRITPGSAMPKLPEAQDQELNDMAKAGMFAPEQLPSTIMILRAKSWEGSDDLADNLLAVLEKMQQGGPNPQALEAQKQQAAAQQAQAQQQHEAELLAAQTHAKVQVIQAQLQADTQLEHTKHENAMEALQMDRSSPAVKLSGTLGALATQSAEREAGLQSDTAAEQSAKTAMPLVQASHESLLAREEGQHAASMGMAASQHQSDLSMAQNEQQAGLEGQGRQDQAAIDEEAGESQAERDQEAAQMAQSHDMAKTQLAVKAKPKGQ